MQDKENSRTFAMDANIDQDIEIYRDDRTVQIEDNGEEPLNIEDIAVEAINSESIKRNKKTN